MAKLPFVDSHLHLWDLRDPELHYSWLQPGVIHPLLGSIDTIKMPLYAAEQFIAETRFANVKKAIHVQCALGIDDPVKETAWLQACADRTGIPHGIVAATSLASPTAGRELERHAAHRNFRGIRDYAQGDYLVDPSWQRGYSLLARFNAVCCLHVLWEDMVKARDLARKFPNVILCVDHAGFPVRRDAEYYAHWQAGMRAVAEAENAVVKISGLGMFDNAWTIESIRPWVLASIEAFGVERSFFGTNWPVDRLYSSYGDVINAYADLIRSFSIEEQTALFSANAERIFRI
jgi:predicted TIM-barrel fold metal-dependent hydrolase